jgi:hypothetical protein
MGGTGMFERDLASLACHAALDLDNLIRGQSQGLDSVTSLVGCFRERLSLRQEGNSVGLRMDPTTVVVMRRAFGQARPTVSVTSTQQFRQESMKMAERLGKVVAESDSVRNEEPEELQQLKRFCLAVSRGANALRPSFFDKPWYDRSQG